MKVTVEGDLDQVVATLSLPRSDTSPSPRQARLKENEAKRKEFTDRRRVVRQAFEKVRYSQNDRAVSDMLLAALTRTTGVTDADLEIARNVLHSATAQPS